MTTMPARVLDVGNCDHDHSLIRKMLTDHFDVFVDRASTIDEAIDHLRSARYELVLFNRIIDADGREGLELICRAQADDSVPPVPIMMISNFAQSQETCLAAGGVRGFGKAALQQPATIDLLARYLPRK